MLPSLRSLLALLAAEYTNRKQTTDEGRAGFCSSIIWLRNSESAVDIQRDTLKYPASSLVRNSVEAASTRLSDAAGRNAQVHSLAGLQIAQAQMLFRKGVSVEPAALRS